MSTIDPKFLDIEHDGEIYHIPVGGNAVIDDTAGSGDTDKAWSANKLVTELAKKIGGNKRVWYGTATFGVIKNILSVSVSNFDSLQTGDVFHISNMLDCYPDSGYNLFIFINDINPAIQVRTATGAAIPQGEHLFTVGSSATFVYDGTYMLLVGGTHASTTTYGTTKLENSSSSSSTTTALVPAALKSVVDNRIAPLETSVAGKADKDTDAVEGNFAAFDANGNPVDSGHKHSDYITSHQDISGKADKVSGATSGNFAGLDSNGNLTDSGKKASDFLETGAIDDTAGTGDTDKVWSADKLANENTLTKTITTPASIQSFTDGAAWPMEMEIAVEAVQSGSGDPSPSNVRPITGWDGANVRVMSKNLLRKTENAVISNIHYEWNEDGTIHIHGTGSSNNSNFLFENNDGFFTGNYIVSMEVVSWTQSGKTGGGLYARDDSLTNFIAAKRENVSETTTNGLNRLWFWFEGGTIIDATVKLMVRFENETSSTFEPPLSKVYPISFGQNVYGGTLGVKADGTGELVLTHKSFLISSKEWTYESNYTRFTTLVSDIKIGSARTVNVVASCFQTISDGRAVGNVPNNSIYNGTTYIYVKDTDHSTSSAFTTAYGDQRIMYPLDTAVSYTLSAPQVLSLLGQNNVWADTGDINSLSYVRRQDIGFIREDTSGQIRAAVTPVQEELEDTESSLAIVIDGDTAPKAITSGQYLFVKNHSTLATGAYHATAAIAKDASVTGNNVTADENGIANTLAENLGTVIESGKITSGSVANGDTPTSFTVNFTKTFTSEPIVVANVYSYSTERPLSVYRIYDVSTSGFKVAVLNTGDASASLGSTRCVSWVAIQ